MIEEVQEAVAVLVGRPLWGLGRAVDLAWFAFGERRSATVRGQVREVGEYALHVQCAWRITQGDTIVVASRDIYCPPHESDEPTPEDFDWEKGNRFDRIVEQLFRKGSRQFTVKGVAAGNAGRLTIALDQGYMVEVFPHDSESGEYWRFFKPFSNEPHFVVTGRGLRHE